MNQSIDIDELKLQRARLTNDSEELTAHFNRVTSLLSNVSGVMGPGTLLGRGINNLSDVSGQLSVACRNNLNQISDFVEARIMEAEAGNQGTSSDYDATIAHLNSINFQ